MEELLKECDEAYEEANHYFSLIEPMTAYEYTFEAVEDPIMKKKADANDENQAKGQSGLAKVFSNLIKLFGNLITSINNFISKIFMNDAERAAFDKFEQEAKNDPALKGKTVSVKDYRAIQKQREDLIRRAEAEIDKAKNGQPNQCKQLMDEIGDFLGKNIKPAVAILGVDLAIKMAKSSLDSAKAMKTGLQNNKELCEFLEEQLGKGGAKKFKKDVSRLSNEYSIIGGLQRMVFRVKNGYVMNAEDCVRDSISQVSKMCGSEGIGAQIKAIAGNLGLAAKVMGNKDLRDTIGKVGKAATDAGVNAAVDHVHKKVARAIGGKAYDNKTGEYSSGSKFFGIKDRGSFHTNKENMIIRCKELESELNRTKHEFHVKVEVPYGRGNVPDTEYNKYADPYRTEISELKSRIKDLKSRINAEK